MGDSKLGYIPALDGIRALAIVMVVLVHAGTDWLPGGFLGVDVFFVLSGYLITRLLVAEHDRTGRIALGRFYLRRLRRLYPALLLLLAVYVLVWPLIIPQVPAEKHWLDATIAALYLSDYTRTMGIEPSGISHLWSLSIEEHFYLLWPIALLAAMKLRRAGIAIGALFVAATAWRLFEFWSGSSNIYFRFDTHASGLALGCLIGYLNLRLSRIWGMVGLAGLAACAVTFSSSDPDIYTYGFTLVEVFAAMVILARPAYLGALSWLGRMSYGLYLWHVPIMTACRMAGLSYGEQLFYGGAGGLLMACLSYYTVEAYFRRRPRAIEPALSPATR